MMFVLLCYNAEILEQTLRNNIHFCNVETNNPSDMSAELMRN